MILTILTLAAAVSLWAQDVAVSAPGLEECLPHKRCRKVVESAFSEQFKSQLKEVEASLPERFFKGAAAFAERRLDSKGHFIRLVCPGAGEAKKRVCSEANRSLLEERIYKVALLKALPLELSLAESCYDPYTWEIFEPGEKALRRAERLWPKINARMGVIAGESFQ